MNLEYQDGLTCPDCGSAAAAIGHTFTDAHGLIGFQETPLHMTTRRDGSRLNGTEPGFRTAVVGRRDVTRYGSTTSEDVTREVVELTHRCTNPECSVVFPREMGRRR